MKKAELREKFRSILPHLLEELPIRDIKAEVPLTGEKEGARADMIATVKIGTVTRKLVFEFKQRGFPMELERGIVQLKALTGHDPQCQDSRARGRLFGDDLQDYVTVPSVCRNTSRLLASCQSLELILARG